jgi:hypothetical protein
VVRTKVLLVGENHRFYFEALDVRVDNGSVANIRSDRESFVDTGKMGAATFGICSSTPPETC